MFDHFGKPTQPITFSVHLQYSSINNFSTYSLINNDYQAIDNLTILGVDFIGERIKNKSINITIMLVSLSYSYVAGNINTTLVVELLPIYIAKAYRHAFVILLTLSAVVISMKLKEVFGLVALLVKQPHHCVLTTIVSLLIVNRPVKVILNYLTQSMLSVIITELEELVGNAVQDTLYHMTPLTVSVYTSVVLDGQC